MKYIYTTSCDPLNEGENTQQVPGNMKGEGFIAGGCHLGKKVLEDTGSISWVI